MHNNPARVSWTTPPLQNPPEKHPSPLPQRLLTLPARRGSLSSTHVLFSGFLATSSSAISGISSENAGGELISGWLSGRAAKRQPPRALFASGARCRTSNSSGARARVRVVQPGRRSRQLVIWGGGNTVIYSPAGFASGVA